MSSGFISETELAEKRKVRQEEWEKVRQPHQPLEAPEEEYDHRSLYDRLQEQKQKKEFEYEEAHRLKNMIKGLDDDEVDFLDLVDRSKLEEERKKTIEEEREMADFRNKVASLQEKSLEQRIQQEIRKPVKVNNISSGRKSQQKLLAGAVVKKQTVVKQNCVEKSPETDNKDKNLKRPAPKLDAEGSKRAMTTGSLTCIGILPGLGTYDNSSGEDSDESTDIEDESIMCFDLLGREIKKKEKIQISEIQG